MSDLEISVEKVRGVEGAVLIAVNGEIHATTVIPFQKRVNSAIDSGVSKIILDMEKVKYVNSTGMGYLINLSDTLEAKQGALAFANIQPKVMVVFNMLGMERYMKVFTTREQAVQAISTGLGSAPPSRTPAKPASPRPAPAVAAAPARQPMAAQPHQPTFAKPPARKSLGRRILNAIVWTLAILVATAAVSFASIMIYRTTLPPSVLGR